MTNIPRPRSEIIGDWTRRVDERAAELGFTAFVCGPAVPVSTDATGLSDSARMRVYISKKLEAAGVTVVWGEHHTLQEAAGNTWIRGFNDADKEMQFAHLQADLVIVFPDSPGSFAELGGFGMHRHIPVKLLAIFERKRKTSDGFVVKALARAAKTRKATIWYRDFKRPSEIWRAINRKIDDMRMIKVTGSHGQL